MLSSAKVMCPSLRRRARRTSLLGIGALATGLFALAPATAGAHRTAHLQSGVSSSGPLQEPATGPASESATGPASESSPKPAASTTGETPSQEPRSRHDSQAQAGCSVNLEATPSTIAPGAPLGLAGALSCPAGASTSEQAVTLYQKISHTPGLQAVASATTEANGEFKFNLSGPEANSAFYVRCDGAKSAHVKVKVALQINLETPATGSQLFAGTADRTSGGVGGPIAFTGTVSPATAGAGVTLERREHNGAVWYVIGHGQLTSEGKFSILHTFFRRGEAVIRVVVRTHEPHTTTVSAPITYQISPRHHKTARDAVATAVSTG